jgi:two-component system sensor kinase FixL
MSQTDRPEILRSLETLPAMTVLEGLARLHQAVFAADAEGRVVWTSDGLGGLRGATGWEMGRPGRDYFVDPERLDEIHRRFLEEGRVVGERAELKGRRGQAIPVEINAVRIPSATARPIFVAIVRPVERREREDRRLRDTVGFLSGVLDASPAAVLAVDPHGFVTYANAAIEALLGHPPRGILDKPATVLTSRPETLASVLLRAAERPTLELELRHADGSPRLVSVAASELHLPDGRSAGSVLLLHDLTEQRRQEDELRRKNDALEDCVQGITHDLRSPLVSLLGFSRLLRQEYGDQLDDTGRHFLDRIEKAGRTMETLINDLVDLSRIGTERQADRVNVAELLEHLRAELKPRLESQAVRLVLPQDPGLVSCDRTRLYQVFSNLIGNALDYMGPVEDAEIRIEVDHSPERHHLVVRDNGRGIDPGQSERIFELFQSGGTRADGRRGTGIGLAIVKKIAQSQGGRVWVESRPGEGAAFHLVLPHR